MLKGQVRVGNQCGRHLPASLVLFHFVSSIHATQVPVNIEFGHITNTALKKITETQDLHCFLMYNTIFRYNTEGVVIITVGPLTLRCYINPYVNHNVNEQKDDIT